MEEAKRARLWRPLPPMPTKSMLPRGCPITRTIRVTGGAGEGNALGKQFQPAPGPELEVRASEAEAEESSQREEVGAQSSDGRSSFDLHLPTGHSCG